MSGEAAKRKRERSPRKEDPEKKTQEGKQKR